MNALSPIDCDIYFIIHFLLNKPTKSTLKFGSSLYPKKGLCVTWKSTLGKAHV